MRGICDDEQVAFRREARPEPVSTRSSIPGQSAWLDLRRRGAAGGLTGGRDDELAAAASALDACRTAFGECLDFGQPGHGDVARGMWSGGRRGPNRA